MDTVNAATEITKETQPLISVVLFWRRFTSMFVRCQSPVFSFQPDQCSASCSSDMARNCFDVNVGFDDIS